MHCIAHKKDLDGLGSHAILRRYAKEQGIEAVHHFSDYDSLGETIAELSRSLTSERVVIADLGCNAKLHRYAGELRRLCERNEVVWIDHHDWDDAGELVKAGFRLVLSTEKCAAELVQEEFMPGDEHSRRIAELAHAHDFREENELAWKLYDVISSGYDRMRFVELLASGVLWCEEFERAYRKYQEAKRRGYEYIDAHTMVLEVSGYTCAMALSEKYLSSTLACLHLQRLGTDFVVVVYPDGKLSFRRNSERVDLGRIARAFGGGGRATAAGAKLDMKVDEENYRRVFLDIAARIERVLEAESR